MKNYVGVIKSLIGEYGNEKCALNFNSPYELLIAVILSSQCTDVRVNKVTEVLFKVANTPKQIVALGEEKLKEYIYSCGFYNAKAKNIIKTSKDLIEKYNGNVPSTMEELVALDGVGEKTASVVLAVAFNIPAFAVDTHVFRVSNRIGLANANTAHKVMQMLMKRVPKEFWIDGHYSLVLHGRNVCSSRKPKCEQCLINNDCKFYKNNLRKK